MQGSLQLAGGIFGFADDAFGALKQAGFQTAGIGDMSHHHGLTLKLDIGKETFIAFEKFSRSQLLGNDHWVKLLDGAWRKASEMDFPPRHDYNRRTRGQ